MRGRERKDASDSRLPIDGEYGETERSFSSSTGGFTGKPGVLDGYRQQKVSAFGDQTVRVAREMAQRYAAHPRAPIIPHSVMKCYRHVQNTTQTPYRHQFRRVNPGLD